MFSNECKGALLQSECRSFLNSDLRSFAMTAEGCEDCDIEINAKRIVPPVASRDHSTVEIHDPRQFLAIKGGNRAPVPESGKRRDNAQALFTLGWC